jgi:hypothetical protein
VKESTYVLRKGHGNIRVGMELYIYNLIVSSDWSNKLMVVRE